MQFYALTFDFKVVKAFDCLQQGVIAIALYALQIKKTACMSHR
jgi:hypothetical protein